MMTFELLEPRHLFAGALPGDANLDGIVNLDDYALLDAGHRLGDLDGNGRINIDDYAAIDGHLGRTLADVTGPLDPTLAGYTVLHGKQTITQPGAVLEKFLLTDGGWIQVDAPNVTIRDFVIADNAAPGNAITFDSDATGGLVERGEILDGTAGNAVKISNGTLRGLWVHDMPADAFRVRHNVTIEGCYVHDLALADGSHGDGVQMYPTDGGGHVIRNNTFDARGANAALFQVDGGWRIEANYLRGGNYTIQMEGHAKNVIRNNVFEAGQYGTHRVGAGDRSLGVWEGNVDTNGKAVGR